MLAILSIGHVGMALAASVDDATALFGTVPAPPATLTAAGAATQITPRGGNATLTAPAYVAIESKLKAQLTAASMPQGKPGDIDFARMQSDPGYAAQVQARMQAMSTQEKMAFAQQMSAAQGAGSAGSGVVAAFLGSQRAADQAAQGKIRSEFDAVLQAAGARHKALDVQLNAQANACPTDKTGWPESRCTAALGEKSIKEHRAIEDAALAQEGKAFADARAAAMMELAKARSVARQAQGSSAAPLAAWVGLYTELLRVYAEAITLRAGFWAHVDTSKYTGQVTIYVDNPDYGIVWPLTHPDPAREGL